MINDYDYYNYSIINISLHLPIHLIVMITSREENYIKKYPNTDSLINDRNQVDDKNARG